MSSEGLSRRRVANNPATSSTTVADSTTPSANSSPGGTPTATHSHAGSAFSGGGKYAYDPRDLDMTEEDARGGKMPKLTIMEEVLLLGLKDKQVSPPELVSIQGLDGLTVVVLGLLIFLE